VDVGEAGPALGQELAVIEAHEIGAQIGDGAALDAMARLPIGTLTCLQVEKYSA
jgi:hypothetical protein